MESGGLTSGGALTQEDNFGCGKILGGGEGDSIDTSFLSSVGGRHSSHQSSGQRGWRWHSPQGLQGCILPRLSVCVGLREHVCTGMLYTVQAHSFLCGGMKGWYTRVYALYVCASLARASGHHWELGFF